VSVGLLIITHNEIGRVLLDTATSMLGTCPMECSVVSLTPSADPDALMQRARDEVARLNKGDGVLVLTDMFGATPSNIAASLCGSKDIMVVAGVNLPMLIRVMNYPHLTLAQLANKAITGGNDGIFPCQPTGSA
jgi:PTS system mannose-specific IIA component